MPMNPPSSQPLKAYAHQDAVASICMWTGLDTGLVGQVLDAKYRYLQVAGIAAAEWDAELQAERETFKDLLPESPTFIDGRETDWGISYAASSGCKASSRTFPFLGLPNPKPTR